MSTSDLIAIAAVVAAVLIPILLFAASVRKADREKIDAAIAAERSEREQDVKNMRTQVDANRALIADGKLHLAENYVSRDVLTDSLVGLRRELESGFRNLDQKMDMLFDRPNPRRSPAS